MKLTTKYTDKDGHIVTGFALHITLPHRTLLLKKNVGEVEFVLLRYHHAEWHEIRRWDANTPLLQILDYVANIPEKMTLFQLP